MKRVIPLLIIAVMASCSTQKTVTPSKLVQPSKPRHHSAEVLKAPATAILDGHTYTVSCNLQTVRDSMVMISITPLLGIELFRIEATPSNILVIDKLNRKYSNCTYDDVKGYTTPSVTYKDVQEVCMGERLKSGEKISKLEYDVKGKSIVLTLDLTNIVYDKGISIRPVSLGMYKQVNFKTMLPL